MQNDWNLGLTNGETTLIMVCHSDAFETFILSYSFIMLLILRFLNIDSKQQLKVTVSTWLPTAICEWEITVTSVSCKFYI